MVKILIQWLLVCLDIELVGLLYRRHILHLSSHAVFLLDCQNSRNMPLVGYFKWLLLHTILEIFLCLYDIEHGMILEFPPAHPSIRIGE